MKKNNTSKVYLMALAIVISTQFFSSCTEKSMDGMIVFTQIAENKLEMDLRTGTTFEHLSESSILIIDPNQSAKPPKKLTEDYFSACSPDISYDGRFMLFAAQKKPTDSWQIWEMNLSNLKARQITSFYENCTSPVYLPDGRFVFSRSETTNPEEVKKSLFTGNLDGSGISQITFNPQKYSLLSVLQDGRVLAFSQQVISEEKYGQLLVSRPDGTKQDLFYQCFEGSQLISQAKEIGDGEIVFIETDEKNNNNGNIVSINYNRSLNSRKNLTAKLKGDFCNISSFQQNRYLVSYRPEGDNFYALYEYSVENRKPSLIYKKEGYSILEAIVVKKHERPRKLPSEVNMGVKTGLLVCQDINFYGIEGVINSDVVVQANKIEILGVDSLLGVVNVEEDGSVYLKIIADTPFRLQTLSAEGKVVKGPGNWIYLRPNERRGCVGCHAGNEQSPFNRQPLSVKKDPAIIPAHIKGVHEQKVELE